MSVTTVPDGNTGSDGEISTVPEPVPAFVSVNLYVGANFAVANVLASIGTSQVGLVPAPAHAPPQPANVEPGAGVAVSVTGVPAAKDAPQVGRHSIPPGKLTTVP